MLFSRSARGTDQFTKFRGLMQLVRKSMCSTESFPEQRSQPVPLGTGLSEPYYYHHGCWAAGPQQQRVQEAEAGKGSEEASSFWGWGYTLFCFGFMCHLILCHLPSTENNARCDAAIWHGTWNEMTTLSLPFPRSSPNNKSLLSRGPV